MTNSEAQTNELVRLLNKALGWEMRAETLYYHFAAYIRGINRLHLKPFFEAEGAESVMHAQAVREQIVKLGGEATTDRDPTEIVQTTDYRVMLQEAFTTETKAADGYRAILAMEGVDSEMYDAIEQIFFQEQRSVEELTQLIES